VCKGLVEGDEGRFGDELSICLERRVVGISKVCSWAAHVRQDVIITHRTHGTTRERKNIISINLKLGNFTKSY
jgi:hypothetical protein